MEHIELLEVQKKYAEEIWKFRQEILECDATDEDQFAGCLSLDESNTAEEWINICELRKDKETCEKAGNTVPSHTYLAVRKSDDKVVGVIDLRHHINHPILGTWGGHCGYSVRPSERGKGYASEALTLLKEYSFRYLNMHQLYAYIPAEHVASKKLFEKAGFEHTCTLKSWKRDGEKFTDIMLYQLMKN